MLKSTRLEDMVYQDLRRSDDGLDALESSCREKLSTFPELSRDIYQSFYSLNIKKNETDTLERLEQKRDQSMEQLRQLLEQIERSGPDKDLEKRALDAANRAQSQVNQADAVGRMVRDNALKNKFQITGVLLDQNAAGFSFSLEPFCAEVLRTSELTQNNIAEHLLSARV